ncbi:hypothetical protein, partial [Streptomyces sp. NPDC057910]|uniref:hypothetical protein n=1 Tax=Streptomyces sp. NPDC057910 TaxID=3346278 RepID=UPI0036E5DA6C
FTTRDTAPLHNRYQYADTNPITNTDPTGQTATHDAFSYAWIAIGFLAAIVTLAITVFTGGWSAAVGTALAGAVLDSASAAVETTALATGNNQWDSPLNTAAYVLGGVGLLLGAGTALHGIIKNIGKRGAETVTGATKVGIRAGKSKAINKNFENWAARTSYNEGATIDEIFKALSDKRQKTELPPGLGGGCSVCIYAFRETLKGSPTTISFTAETRLQPGQWTFNQNLMTFQFGNPVLKDVPANEVMKYIGKQPAGAIFQIAAHSRDPANTRGHTVAAIATGRRAIAYDVENNIKGAAAVFKAMRDKGNFEEFNVWEIGDVLRADLAPR